MTIGGIIFTFRGRIKSENRLHWNQHDPGAICDFARTFYSGRKLNLGEKNAKEKENQNLFQHFAAKMKLRKSNGNTYYNFLVGPVAKKRVQCNFISILLFLPACGWRFFYHFARVLLSYACAEGDY